MKKHIEKIVSLQNDDIDYSRPKDAVLDVALFVRVSTSSQSVDNQIFELAEICERNNVRYLYPPEHVFNEFGGLNENALRDSVHANSWYGKQILEQIYNEIIREMEQ